VKYTGRVAAVDRRLEQQAQNEDIDLVGRCNFNPVFKAPEFYALKQNVI
jgi:hypothetical protein